MPAAKNLKVIARLSRSDEVFRVGTVTSQIAPLFCCEAAAVRLHAKQSVAMIDSRQMGSFRVAEKIPSSRKLCESNLQEPPSIMQSSQNPRTLRSARKHTPCVG